MQNIFRVPVDNQHFKDTIENGKPLSEILNLLVGEEIALANRHSQNGIVRYWGSLPGESNKRNFLKMKSDDDILFYRSGKYIAKAKIAFVTTNEKLAKQSWAETATGETWQLVYFLKEINFIEIPSFTLNKEFGFKDGPVMGFGMISDEKVLEFSKRHISLTTFIQKLGYERKIEDKVNEELSKVVISSPYEAQYFLVNLGNSLDFDTYVPASDGGRTAFGKKLDELITLRRDDLKLYTAPALFDPLSNIDVIWFKENYQPKFFYEVIHKTGWSEALLRLDLASKHYESAFARIVGPEENKPEFSNSIRRWSGPKEKLEYRNYNQLLEIHSESLHFNNLINEFLY